MTAPNNETAERIRSYRDRMVNLLSDIAERQEDIKELCLEIKCAGFNAPELKRWATAELKDKVSKRVAEIGDAVTYGEVLGHDLGMVPDNEDRARRDSSESFQDDEAA